MSHHARTVLLGGERELLFRPTLTKPELLALMRSAGGYSYAKKVAAQNFGAVARSTREARGLGLRQVARQADKSREYLRDVEAGAIWPDKEARAKILSSPEDDALRKHYDNIDDALAILFREEAEDAAGEQVESQAAPTPAPAPPPSAPPAKEPPVVQERHPFRVALYLARNKAALTCDELGVLVGVAGSTISNWETDKWAPTLENYRRLVELFPDLKNHQTPPSRDIGRQAPHRAACPPRRNPHPWQSHPPSKQPRATCSRSSAWSGASRKARTWRTTRICSPWRRRPG